MRAIHAALLRTGKVLLVAGSGNDRNQFAAGTFKTTVWDPTTNTFADVTTPWDAFCSGHTFEASGSLLVEGGNTAYPGPATNNANAGSKQAYRFDPTSQTYARLPDTAIARWYPALVELGDGRILTIGGLDETGSYSHKFEIWDGTSWSAAADPPATINSFTPMYMGLHLMDDGRLFYSGVNVFGAGPTPPGIWNLTSNRYSPVSGLTDAQRRDQGFSVMLPPAQDQKIMVVGGGQQDDTVGSAVASTAIIDLKSATPTYTPGPSISEPKMYVNVVLLPDGTVLQTGGGTKSIKAGKYYANSAQIYDPKANSWRTVASPTVGRLYHGSAILLPDGRVATFGSNPLDGFEMRIEVYSPPYMRNAATRPVITSAPRDVTYGGTYGATVDASQGLKGFTLVRPSAVTHQSDPNQRELDVPFTLDANGDPQITLPSNPNLAPPGWYMLFALDQLGTPSVASWVHLG